MAISKTERGRLALEVHSGELGLADRRVLILCDGVRGREDIVAMLGAKSLPLLERLLDEGYLTQGRGIATRGPKAAAAPAVASAPTPIRPPAAEPARPVPVIAPARSVSRRSLAASKMYLLDMLQLQRDAESVSLRADIQTSPSEDELIYRMMKGLRHLQAVASASYAQRVAERLGELLPEAHLPRLEQMRSAWQASISAAA